MEPLGKNIGGYRGETLDLPAVLRDLAQAAASHHWQGDIIPLDYGAAAPPSRFIAYRRPAASPRLRLYLSAGIHGDEPAGPLAALQLLREDRWPTDAALWFCPCLNPTGFPLSRRENVLGIDINRDYRHFESAEARAHVAWLQDQPPFDLGICLHEDWESRGFYVYELNPGRRPSLAAAIVAAVARVCPIERAPLIDNWPADNGVIRPRLNPEDRPRWAEAIYLITHKARLTCTLEAPSDFPLPTRVAALVTGVRAILAAL